MLHVHRQNGGMRVRVVVHGRVQGVGFRYSAQEAASSFGLTGWVRNRHDGAVEAEAQGSDDEVGRFTAWCHQGPSWARVDAVDVTELPEADDETGFMVTG